MCMLVYIGSDTPLRTWPYDPENPSLHVTDVPPDAIAVKQHFHKPFVYYAGAYEKCGCGFQYGFGEYPETEDDPEQIAAANRSRHAIAEFARQALAKQKKLEFYMCWAGDEEKPPLHRAHKSFIDFSQGFKERELLEVGEPAAG